jgi:hypothetical protein
MRVPPHYRSGVFIGLSRVGGPKYDPTLATNYIRGISRVME